MPYSVLEDFRGGVDRRRPVYALPPGTLWDGINCHITRGGDIEKRKAFADQGTFDSGTFGLLAKGEGLYTFGSNPPPSNLPANVTYQRLQHPFNVPMTGLVGADLFGGSIYAVASFADGANLHFYNGTLVADWNDGIVRVNMGNLAGVATRLAALIDASANYVATATGNVITITAQTAGVPFTVLVLTTDGGLVNDQTIVAASVTPNTPGVTGVAANASFQITAGDGTGTITSITIGGTEVLTNTVTWATSNINTASLIATEINTHTGTTGWTAAAVGQTVTMTKNVTGAANNALTVGATWTNTLKINNTAAASAAVLTQTVGGIDAVAAVAQVMTVTLGGTFDTGDGFGVRLVSGITTLTTEYFGNYAKPFGAATCVKTHKRKVYVGAGPILDFCMVNDATHWNVDLDPGAGFVNASTQVGGSEAALALGTYQGRLAVFSRRAVQLWTMQNDDTLNNLDQVLENTGTRAPHSIQEYAGNDIFYLDDTGIRSLRARDASNNAFLTDVGVAIDPLVREWMRSGASEDQIAAAQSVIDPIDGRFWLAIGTRIYVYSYFPTSKVAAWTWYEPGFVPDKMVRTKSRVYVRANNHLYLYGGNSGEEYDASQVTVQLPFFTGQKPGTFKNFDGFDMAATSEWTVRLYVNPDPDKNGANRGLPGITGDFVDMGSDSGVTYFSSEWDAGVHATHIAAYLTQSKPEYASLSQVSFSYTGAEEST